MSPSAWRKTWIECSLPPSSVFAHSIAALPAAQSRSMRLIPPLVGGTVCGLAGSGIVSISLGTDKSTQDSASVPSSTGADCFGGTRGP